MEKTYSELKEEAKALGIEFTGNIAKKDLIALIENFYNNEVAQDSVKVDEKIVKEIPKIKETRDPIREAKEQAFKLVKCIISSNDKRTNDVETTAYLSFENQYFSKARIVPLDVPVEIEYALVQIALSTMIVQHKDEIVSGRRTGNKVPGTVRKFNVQLL
jgi:hypothetical protein